MPAAAAHNLPGDALVAAAYDPAPGVTLAKVKAAIPKHCFQKSALRSTFYLFQDFAIIGALYYLRPYFCFGGVASIPTHLLWWNLVGFFGWCLFVVGHDCGHGTYSNNAALNFVVGHIAHTPLLVPYVGWQTSHRKHHLNHNHVENDHSWKPLPRSAYQTFMADPVMRFFRCNWGLLFVYPAYLLTTEGDFVSGNHFNPWDRKLFEPEETLPAAVSALSCAAFLGALFANFGPLFLLDAYFVPYMIFASWLSLVTYLQHTDPKATYYRNKEWNYFKGALSTVDRSYGAIIDYLHHDIGTHVVHHMLFTSVPHYHLKEATRAVKPMLGDAFLFDDRPIVSAFLSNVAECRWVDEKANVCKYQYKEEESAKAK